MKIALIAPPYPLEEAPSPPLGLCYVAAACEATGAQTIILDYIVSQYTPEKLHNALAHFKPDVVGATSVTMNFPEAIRIIQDVKAFDPGIITMMGGPHVSFDVHNTLTRCPELDLIVIGEGEQTLQELLATIRQRDTWKTIPGIAFREGTTAIVTPPRPLIANLDALPLPARHLLPLSRYQALGFPVSIITSRGCPNQCIFCLGRRMVGPKARFRDATQVVDEIEHILSYGFTRINIADDLFTASSKRVESLCAEINARGVRFDWSAFARVNTVTPQMLKSMRAAGCDSISFGIESANPAILERVKKGITLDQARRAVAWSKAAGLRAHASFMVGLPGETPETLEETRRFAEELDIEHGYHFLSPFPGTTLREEIDTYDLEILTEDWHLYDANQAIVRTAHLSAAQMNAFVAAIYAKYQAKTDEIEARYLQGTCTEAEFFMIEGYYRMKLIYKLLAEDIIENNLPPPDTATDPLEALTAHVIQATGMTRALVTRTVKSLAEVGHLRNEPTQTGTTWFWTYNRQQAHSPFIH